MDPAERFAVLVEAMATRPGVGPPSSTGRRGFGSSALTVDGSIFAMVVGGGLVFEEGRMGVDQILAVRRTADGHSGLPAVRSA